MSSSASPYSIDWNGKFFVFSVGNGNEYATSSDGIHWDYSSSLLIPENVYNIKWLGDNRFFVCGNTTTTSSIIHITGDKQLTVSPNKNTNIDIIYDIESDLEKPHKIVFPPSTLLAIGNNGCKIAVSNDEGVSWESTDASNIFTSSVKDVVWNGHIWVAAGTGGNVLASSLDGYQWTSRYKNSEGVNGIDWSKEQSRFLAIGTTGTISTSMDGIYWKPSYTGLFSAGNDIRWNGRLWVATGTPNGTGGKSIAYSSDGTSWQYPSQANLFSIGGTNIYYDEINERWTVLGTDSTANNAAISCDGIKWEMTIQDISSIYTASYELPFPLTAPVDSSLIAQPSKYVFNNPTYGTVKIAPLSIAGGEGKTTLAYSENGGIEWTAIANSPFTKCNRICWNGRLWAGVGAPCIAVSMDGIEWNAVNTDLFTECYDVAWNGHWFVAVGYKTGSSTRIARSSDGINWSAISETVFSGAIATIEWSGSVWLAYGSSSISGVSEDVNAANWTAKNLYVLDATNVAANSTTTQSSYSGIHSAVYVIDGSDSTYWESAQSQYDGSGNYIGINSTNYIDGNGNASVVAGEWVQIDLSSASIIHHYSINSPSSKSWVLLESNDQTNWVQLDSFAYSYSTNATPIYTVRPISNNTTAYISYRLVLSSIFNSGSTVQINEFRLLTGGTQSLASPYQIRPVPLKNHILHPIRVLGDNRNICCITDLCGNLIGNAATIISGLTASVSSQTYDGYNHIVCSLSGELSCMTNTASLTDLSWTNQIKGQLSSTSRTSIYSCCYNTKYILLAGEDGISYGSIGNNQYPAIFHDTNAASLFSGGAIHCVSSNSGYGHVVMHNTLYLRENDALSLITPKYYADGLNERTQITMKGYAN